MVLHQFKLNFVILSKSWKFKFSGQLEFWFELFGWWLRQTYSSKISLSQANPTHLELLLWFWFWLVTDLAFRVITGCHLTLICSVNQNPPVSRFPLFTAISFLSSDSLLNILLNLINGGISDAWRCRRRRIPLLCLLVSSLSPSLLFYLHFWNQNTPWNDFLFDVCIYLCGFLVLFWWFIVEVRNLNNQLFSMAKLMISCSGSSSICDVLIC